MELFENAGSKIKRWAAGLFVVEAICAVIIGVITMFSDEDLFFTGLLVMAGGVLIAFITSLFLSAFGELVESTTENKNINAKILEKLNADAQTSVPHATAPATAANTPSPAKPTHQNTAANTYRNTSAVSAIPDTWICASCGTSNSKNYYQCKKCGKQRSSK